MDWQRELERFQLEEKGIHEKQLEYYNYFADADEIKKLPLKFLDMVSNRFSQQTILQNCVCSLSAVQQKTWLWHKAVHNSKRSVLEKGDHKEGVEIGLMNGQLKVVGEYVECSDPNMTRDNVQRRLSNIPKEGVAKGNFLIELIDRDRIVASSCDWRTCHTQRNGLFLQHQLTKTDTSRPIQLDHSPNIRFLLHSFPHKPCLVSFLRLQAIFLT
ncbi:unnamed protein product [Caenorhabditis nigoni]